MAPKVTFIYAGETQHAEFVELCTPPASRKGLGLTHEIQCVSRKPTVSHAVHRYTL